MKISVNRLIFTNAINNISRAVASRATVPALEGILIEAKEDVILTGYDLETGMMKHIPADVYSEGAMVLGGKLLADLCKKMNGDIVQLEVEKDVCKISCGRARYELPTLPADEYPAIPKAESKPIVLKADTLKSMIKQTIFGVSTVDVRPVHKGIMFELENDILTAVSTDGYRLAVRKEPVKGENFNFIMQAKAASEILKLAGDEVELIIDKNHILINTDGYTIFSRLLQGEFLDYTKVLTGQHKTKITVDVKALSDTINRVAPFAPNAVKGMVSENAFAVSCATQAGKAEDEIECETEGESLEIGFNSRYMAEALKVCESESTTIEFNGALSPIVITPSESAIFVVLPVRLKK